MTQIAVREPCKIVVIFSSRWGALLLAALLFAGLSLFAPPAAARAADDRAADDRAAEQQAAEEPSAGPQADAQRGAAGAVQRTVLFRDGSVLRVPMPAQPLPWRRVSPVGEVIEHPLPYRDVEQLTLVTTPATEQLASVRRMIAALGDDDFQRRVAAQQQLVERGAKFFPILESSLNVTQDFEARWRLKEVLDVLPTDTASIKADYDLLKTAGEETQGDVGDWSIEVPYRGTAITLDRGGVRALHTAPLEFSLTAEPPVAIVDRIAEDRDELFPKDVQRIDFDRGPQGETLQVGDDLRRTFVSQGVTITSSGGIVSVEQYEVNGRSNGLCAATHDPVYQGVITIRFCLPGNERAPAGVRYVGFWTAHVAPDGTALEAYDIRGRRIAAIKTVRHRKDFLALHSNTPIASIKIVPDPEVDPDYAIDDLVFDTPKPLAEAGDAEHFSVLLTTGERLHCDRVEPGETVALKGLTVGIDRIDVPLEQVAIVVPPKNPSLVPALPDCGFVRLADGSILRCRGGERLSSWRLPELPIALGDVVALWGGETSLIDPEGADWPENSALLMLDGKTEPLADLSLGAAWLEGKAIAPWSEKKFTYETSPLVWFAAPRVRPAGSGLLRLVSGDEIVLAGGDEGRTSFSLVAWSGEGVKIARGKQQWTIPPHEVGSLLLPGRDGG
ncbi:MAG: hypothetical protein RIC55_16290 [Pirellulaceae bacterium]